MSTPEISCVVPAYNAAKYLRQTLESLLAQTGVHSEVIVVDDGSADETAAIAESFAPAVRLLGQPNAGPAAARNRGLAASTARLVTFMDADDLSPPERFALQASAFAKDPALQVCAGMVQNFVGDLVPAGKPVAGYNTDLMMRREVFDQVGLFNAAVPHAARLEWLLRARGMHLREQVLPEVLVYRRLHETSLSHTGANDSLREHLRILHASIKQRREIAPMHADKPCATGTPLAHVAELWRYPVKGMRGESVAAVQVVANGISGDRRFAFLSSGAPAGKPMLTGRERAAMLLCAAETQENRVFVITPAGERFAVDDPACVQAIEASLPQGNRLRLEHRAEPFTDCRPIALLSTETLRSLSAGYGRAVDARRFRANLVLRFADAGTGFPEDALVGRCIRIGAAAELRITERDPRCRMVTLDPETALPEPALMEYLDRHHEGKLGVYAATVVPGPVQVGDPVWLAG